MTFEHIKFSALPLRQTRRNLGNLVTIIGLNLTGVSQISVAKPKFEVVVTGNNSSNTVQL